MKFLIMGAQKLATVHIERRLLADMSVFVWLEARHGDEHVGACIDTSMIFGAPHANFYWHCPHVAHWAGLIALGLTWPHA